jgi:hypothetical protein
MSQDRAALIAALKPGVDYRPGTCRPYRPCPPDFRAVYLAIGWDGIEEHFGANWRTIARWIKESGGDELIAARAALTPSASGRPAPKRRSKLPSYAEAVAALMSGSEASTASTV